MPSDSFTADSYFSETCPTESYDDLSGPYEVWLLDDDGNRIANLEGFERLEFTRAVNGMFAAGYGSYRLEASSDIIDPTDFALDYKVSVQRATPSGVVLEFEGLHRNLEISRDDTGMEYFVSEGADYKSLMKRRIILPNAGDDFYVASGPFTDIMTDLVSSQCETGVVVDADREMPNFQTDAAIGEGVNLTLNYRYTKLADELELLAGLGADWDIVRVDASTLEFQVYFPYKGKDKREGNVCGNEPIVFSIDNLNIKEPGLELFRLDEVNIAYVGGAGVGRDRIILERESLFDTIDDSQWNRIETFLDSGNETNMGSLAAEGDAYLVEHGVGVMFSMNVPVGSPYIYGEKWNLGDRVTGKYKGYVFDMRVISVTTVIDKDNSVTNTPVFFVYPGWTVS